MWFVALIVPDHKSLIVVVSRLEPEVFGVEVRE